MRSRSADSFPPDKLVSHQSARRDKVPRRRLLRCRATSACLGELRGERRCPECKPILSPGGAGAALCEEMPAAEESS